MNDTLTTLETFFQFDDEHAARTEHLKTLGSAEQMAPVQEALRNQAGKHAWPAVSSELYGQFGKLLDISLGDILVRAWNKTKLLDRFLNPEKYDPNESILLSLKEHTITSQHHPHLDVTLNGKEIGRIDFRIDLTLILEGIILKIQAGRICEIRSGHVKGRGAVSSGELVILKRELCNIELPGIMQIHQPA
jgi:hypothetical protein